MERCTKTAESLAGRGFWFVLVAASIEWKDAQSVGAGIHWMEGCTRTAESLAGRGFQSALVAALIECKDTQPVGWCQLPLDETMHQNCKITWWAWISDCFGGCFD
jgi:hypothetical protein